jgi:AmmeMemoRadiSam system radical SAM enzyme/AmmeMemoRadiSam system protein B/AmmeMemoRadiSam system protein A
MPTLLRQVDLPPEGGLLPDGSRLGGWWHDLEGENRIVCDLCPRECHLKPGDRGFCFVRENRDGQMVLNTYGRSTGFCIDPIEKKPLNHFYPGTSVLSFGTAGCNLGCKFCQNHDISKAREVALLSEQATPETIAQAAKQLGCRSVAFTYNDPVIWAEYAIDTAKACRAAGVKAVAVTAGYITPQARGAFYEYMDAANVDLKAFTEKFYYQLTLSHLKPVLDTLEWLKKETDVWFEITNLVIPDANDTADEFRQMCDWILDHVGDDTPLHFSAFHPDFKMMDRPNTPVETLLKAHEIARRQGLKFVYVGNVHDEKHQSTYCPHCGKLLIERDWYELGAYHLKRDRCEYCDGSIPGRFDDRPGDWGRRRVPVPIARFSPPISITPPKQSAANAASNAGEKIVTTAAPPAPRALHEPPQLTPEQETALHRAASRLVAAAVYDRSAELDEPELAELIDEPLMGAFVSLKRQGRLRGCCGVMGAPIALGEAVTRAARRTALEDHRLPRVSPGELAYLDLEVWLLFNPQLVRERGEERIEAVKIGRHGLQIALGENRGLLLPGVAVEAGLDAEGFLRQVCLKAGLRPDAWKNDAAVVQVFEGIAVHGPLEVDGKAGAETPQFSAADLERLVSFCRQNVALLVRGASPSYYMDGPDGSIYGAALSLSINGEEPLTHLSKLSFRPEMPLQSTLFSLTEAAAQALRTGALRVPGGAAVQIDLTLLTDPAMHGTVERPDLRGVDSATRAVIVVERRKSAWAFDHACSPEELLARARSGTEVLTPQEAGVYSFRAYATTNPVLVTTTPRPALGEEVRPAGVAGTFYPADPDQLQQQVDELFEGEAPEPIACSAIMVPHAGLKYSGKVAADVFKRVKVPGTVIVIGPKHTPWGVEWAVAPHRQWQLPGITVASDPELAKELVEAIPGLQLDASAHQREHAIEIELPLLARVAPHARVVGIALGAGNLEQCRKFAEGLASVLEKRQDEVLLVISTDMNHFATDDENRRLDEMAISAVETLDPDTLYNTVRDNQISMCGMLPAVIVLQTLRRLGRLKRAERVAYATSADTTGDKSRVVGYAGMLFL